MQDESKFVLDESGKLIIEPYMEELADLFVSYFKAILMVGHEIPSLEYYMSQGETWDNTFSLDRIECRRLNEMLTIFQVNEPDYIIHNNVPFWNEPFAIRFSPVYLCSSTVSPVSTCFPFPLTDIT